METWLEGVFPVTVYYEDTDFSGYVYHANYLKFFERAREELVGIDYVKGLYERGVHYVVARMELSFHTPARHGDRLEIKTRMRISPSPIGLVEQTAFVKGVKVVSAKIKLVSVDDTGEATRVPPDVLAHYEAAAAAQKDQNDTPS